MTIEAIGETTKDRRPAGLTSLFKPDHHEFMKPSFPLHLISFLFMGGATLLLLSACETGDGWRDGAARPTKVTKQRRGTPAPYYGSNAAGNYYPTSGEGQNSNYRPGVKRYDPNRRMPAAPLAEERSTWRKPAPLTGSGYSY
jgi:hypothetical protein